MARSERESDKRRSDEKWQTCWCCRDQQRACRMAQISAEHTGPAEKKKSGFSATGRVVVKYAGAAVSKKKGTKLSDQNPPDRTERERESK